MIEEEIEILINHIKYLKPLKINEFDTRGCLIDPLLLLFGYNTTDPYEVKREKRVSNNGLVDYVLNKKDIKDLYVEIKKLGLDLDKHILQGGIYAYSDKNEYFIITDGCIYKLIRTIDRKILRTVNLTSKTPIEEKIYYLNLMLNNNELQNFFEKDLTPMNKIYKEKIYKKLKQSEIKNKDKSFFDLFCKFCIEKINYIKGTDKSYLSSKLQKNFAGFYIFTNADNVDFARFLNDKKIGMRQIVGLVQQSLDNKNLVICANHSLKGKKTWGIKIDPDFFKNEKIKK